MTNEINQYDVMARGADESGTNSQWALVYITVNPPNQGPSASIAISPDSLGGLTPEYYQFDNLTFKTVELNFLLGKSIKDWNLVYEEMLPRQLLSSYSHRSF